jgi:hypothetical protein
MAHIYRGRLYVCICVWVYVLCIHAGCHPVCLMSAQAMVRGRKPVATPEYVYMCVHVQIYMRMQSHPRSKLSKGTSIEGGNWRGDKKNGRTSQKRGERESQRERERESKRCRTLEREPVHVD